MYVCMYVYIYIYCNFIKIHQYLVYQILKGTFTKKNLTYPSVRKKYCVGI